MAEQSSNLNLLHELDAMSQTLYQSHSSRRTASLVLPRSATPTINAIPTIADHPIPTNDTSASDHRPRARRMSMSPFRGRPKSNHELDENIPENYQRQQQQQASPSMNQHPLSTTGEKKGIWNWKPIRALSHIGMQRISCLLSVEVVAIQRLPPTMNGLRLAVLVRKKETKDGAVQTMPARVLQGSADFEETLFIRCNVYCSGKPLKFEPRPFLISAVAVDAHEIDFGKNSVDLSLMVKESTERSLEGARIRQWDAAFRLAGKAKGGELVVKIGFQIMEDGGLGLYNQIEGAKLSKNKGGDSSSSFARRQSKSSFSVSSPKVTRSEPPATPSNAISDVDWRGIDDFKLDEPASPPNVQNPAPELKEDDLDLPEFEIIDKGVEIQAEKEEHKEEEIGTEVTDKASESSEVVKEVVHDGIHLTRLTELESIAQQIKALETIVTGDGINPSSKIDQNDDNPHLDADEVTVTREFLQMLELEDDREFKFDISNLAVPANLGAGVGTDGEKGNFLSDLGKGLGPVVHTRSGGYLAAMNPFNVEVPRKDTPKLAMQISKPIILGDQKLGTGFEVFQKLAAVGSEDLASKLDSITAMDELMGKTAEQIAFEGIASAIISGRNKEGASSSAARSIAALKTMATTMMDGRKERILTGIWNVKEEPVIIEEILSLSLQKIEAMAVDALKIQADMAEQEAPFDVSPLIGQDPLDSILSNDWENSCDSANSITMLVVIQLRDPMRRYEKVGAAIIAVVQATRAESCGEGDEDGRFKVTSLHVGGIRMRSEGKRTNWDGEKQRLTAMQWLVSYGLVKAGKKSKNVKAKVGQDLVWSISSRVMADMWLKAMRNPNVKFAEKL